MQGKLTLIVGPDDFVNCPQCDRRMETDHEVLEHDELGPVMLARCDDHGEYRFQVLDE